MLGQTHDAGNPNWAGMQVAPTGQQMLPPPWQLTVFTQEHVPPVQVSFAPQACPQLPQLFESLRTLTHALPQQL